MDGIVETFFHSMGMNAEKERRLTVAELVEQNLGIVVRAMLHACLQFFTSQWRRRPDI